LFQHCAFFINSENPEEKDLKTIHPSNHHIEEKIMKKSRFIGYAHKVENEKNVQTFLQQLRNDHSKSNHICYAYCLGDKEKCVDDGEPVGTAGQPILGLFYFITRFVLTILLTIKTITNKKEL